jgi:ABC-type bacteriocin/lantibiotic exporter with double-glycine peptidase domain
MRALIATLVTTLLATGCVRHYAGTARLFDPAELAGPGWVYAPGMREILQEDKDDCGPATVAMVLARWERATTLEELRRTPVPDGGLTAADLRTLLRDHGLRAFVIEGSVADLEHELSAGRPVIVGTVKPVDQRRSLRHFEVVVAIHHDAGRVVSLDPSGGWRELPLATFVEQWAASGHTTVVALP